MDTTDPADGTIDIFNLLVLTDGNATADPVVPGSTISVGATGWCSRSRRDGHLHCIDGNSGLPQSCMPVSFMLRAEKAYSGGEGAEFSNSR